MGRSTPGEFAYQAVYRYLQGLIDNAPRSGQLRLPSLRALARRLRVSLATVQSAYALLENEGRVVSIAKRGYFVRADDEVAGSPGADLPWLWGQGAAMPASSQLERALHRQERRLLRQSDRCLSQAHGLAGERLRLVLAQRYTRSPSHSWRAEHVHLGPDVRAVLQTLLPALGLRGATALVASPCCWRLFSAMQDVDMRVLEVPCLVSGELDLVAMDHLLKTEPVRAVVMPSCLGMPQGRLLGEHEQRSIAGLLAQYPVWVVENDLDSERCYSTPSSLRLRDLIDPRWLLVLGSLAASAGAEAPYAYVLSSHNEVLRAFARRCFELSPVRQQALACLLDKGEVDAHLRRWREAMRWCMGYLCQQLMAQCGQQLAFEQPAGGDIVWLRLHDAGAVRRVITALAGSTLKAIPGDWFSVQGQHSQYLALIWLDGQTDPLQAALQRMTEVLGQAGEC